MTPTDIPSESIKKFHEQILTRALSAIRLQTLEQRDFSSVVLAMNCNDLADAKAMIKNFRHAFNQRFSSSNKKNAVYNLGIQLFKLSTEVT